MQFEELEQLIKISESSVKACHAAIEVINKLHGEYCDLFRNEIDNLWLKQDGRYKMLNKFVQAKEQFQTLIQLERKLHKDNKDKAK